jgi:hypothetical protein
LKILWRRVILFEKISNRREWRAQNMHKPKRYNVIFNEEGIYAEAYTPKHAFYKAFPEYEKKDLFLEDVIEGASYDVKVVELPAGGVNYFYKLVAGEVPEEQKKYKNRGAEIDVEGMEKQPSDDFDFDGIRS